MASQSNKGRASEHVATAAEYMRALRSLLPLAPSYIGMLQFHSHQPNRTATAGSVAEAVGFKNFRGTVSGGKDGSITAGPIGTTPPRLDGGVPGPRPGR